MKVNPKMKQQNVTMKINERKGEREEKYPIFVPSLLLQQLLPMAEGARAA